MTRLPSGAPARRPATVSIALLAFAVLVGQAASLRAATLNRNLDSYVLFALQSLSFKGRNADPLQGFITGGNVGVNIDSNNGDNGFDLTMGGGGSGHVVVMSVGS